MEGRAIASLPSRVHACPLIQFNPPSCCEQSRGRRKIYPYKRWLHIDPVRAYELTYGQRQSSSMLRWPYPAEFSRFRTAYLKLDLVSRIAG